MVITDQEPTDALLTKTLQPWHEYECTGKEDEYVVNVDVTAKCEEMFNKPQTVVQLADETVHNYWAHKFWVKGNGFTLPLGARLIENMPADEARKHGIGYATMADCVDQEYGGFIGEDGKCYHKTNPNKKWDWWVVGGRWSGFFEEHGDIVQLKDLDLNAMQDAEVEKQLPRYEKFQKIVAGRPVPTWEDTREKCGDIDRARDTYWNDPVIKDLKAGFDDVWDLNSMVKRMNCTREKFIARTRKQAIQTFAVVYKGKWYERGNMGWWGVVTEEKDIDRWDDEFDKLLKSLPPDTWLTAVDCHI